MSDEELRELWIEYCILRRDFRINKEPWNKIHEKWLDATRDMKLDAGRINARSEDDYDFYYTLTNGKTYRTDQPL